MSRELPAIEAGRDDEAASSLQMLRAIRPRIESDLLRFYEQYKQRSGDDDHTFSAIELRVTMFQYEIVREFELLMAHDPKGFAMAVAAKGLIHRLVEFDRHLRDAVIPEMLKVAESRNAVDFERRTRELQREVRPGLAVIRRWQGLRNKATGHYDRDLDVVVELLETVEFEEVLEAAQKFLLYMAKVLVVLRVSISESK